MILSAHGDPDPAAEYPGARGVGFVRGDRVPTERKIGPASINLFLSFFFLLCVCVCVVTCVSLFPLFDVISFFFFLIGGQVTRLFIRERLVAFDAISLVISGI